MRTLKGGLTNHSPSENHSNHSSDREPTLHHYHYYITPFSINKLTHRPRQRKIKYTPSAFLTFYAHFTTYLMNNASYHIQSQSMSFL